MEKRNYRLNWRGNPQPLGSNTFDSVKAYIEHSIRIGAAKLWEFEIFDQYGQLKTNIVNQKNPDLSNKSSYFKIY